MVTYQDAKKTALKVQKSVNACREYVEAYYFYNKDYTGDGANGVVVVKKTGATKSFPQFVLDRKGTDQGKSITF